jgi:hypothetical protein
MVIMSSDFSPFRLKGLEFIYSSVLSPNIPP